MQPIETEAEGLRYLCVANGLRGGSLAASISVGNACHPNTAGQEPRGRPQYPSTSPMVLRPSRLSTFGRSLGLAEERRYINRKIGLRTTSSR